MPTFKRLKEKHPSATMMWFQNGKLWPSRVDAQEAMIGRGEAGRRSDPRQAGTGFRNRERRPTRDRVERTAWTPRGEPSTPAPARNADDKLDWKPKGEFVPAPKRADRPERPDWKSKTRDSRPTSRSEKPEWKPKGSFDRDTKRAWKPKGSFDRDRKPEWKPKGSYGQAVASGRRAMSNHGRTSPKSSNGRQRAQARVERAKTARKPARLRVLPRNVSGSPRRSTRNPWASRQSAIANGAPAASTAIRVRSTRTRRKRSGRSSRRTSGKSGRRSRVRKRRESRHLRHLDP
jgi:hypothetical protein